MSNLYFEQFVKMMLVFHIPGFFSKMEEICCYLVCTYFKFNGHRTYYTALCAHCDIKIKLGTSTKYSPFETFFVRIYVMCKIEH